MTRVQLWVNGVQHEIDVGMSVRALLQHLGVREAALAVEVNRTVIPGRDYEVVHLHAGDRVEVVTLVGGG